MEKINEIVREMREYGSKPPLRGAWLDLADRIEAAHERECEAGAEAAQICGEIGEMIGRKATCKESLQVGNAAAMREALKYLRDASREFHHLILNSKYNEVCDKYKYTEVAKISDAIANANIALSAPPRNCDLYAFRSDAWVAFRKKNQQAWYEDLHLSFPDWLFAEAKGEAK